MKKMESPGGKFNFRREIPLDAACLSDGDSMGKYKKFPSLRAARFFPMLASSGWSALITPMTRRWSAKTARRQAPAV
jgi:hypothetical protein